MTYFIPPPKLLIQKKEYAKYFKIWDLFPGDKYHVIGNHEMDGGTSLKEAVAYRGMQNFYYSFSKNGFKFIVLDGNDKKEENRKGYRSYMGEEQLDCLKNELKISDNPVVIFFHQGNCTDPNNSGERYSIENSLKVRKIFEDYNSFCIFVVS